MCRAELEDFARTGIDAVRASCEEVSREHHVLHGGLQAAVDRETRALGERIESLSDATARDMQGLEQRVNAHVRAALTTTEQSFAQSWSSLQAEIEAYRARASADAQSVHVALASAASHAEQSLHALQRTCDGQVSKLQEELQGVRNTSRRQADEQTSRFDELRSLCESRLQQLALAVAEVERKSGDTEEVRPSAHNGLVVSLSHSPTAVHPVAALQARGGRAAFAAHLLPGERRR